MAKPRRKSIAAIIDASPAEPTPTVEPAEVEQGRAPKTKTRQQTLYLAPAVHEQLRALAFHERTKMHRLVLEGLDRVFADRGLKSIADLSKDG